MNEGFFLFLAKGAGICLFDTYFVKKVICGYFSVKEFKLERFKLWLSCTNDRRLDQRKQSLKCRQSAKESYYKVRQLFSIKYCDTVYYKLREGLQGAMDLLQTAICVMKCDESIIINLRQYIPKLVPRLATDPSPELLFSLRALLSISKPSELLRLRLRPLLSISNSSRWRRLAYEVNLESGRSTKVSKKKNMKKWRGWFNSVNMQRVDTKLTWELNRAVKIKSDWKLAR